MPSQPKAPAPETASKVRYKYLRDGRTFTLAVADKDAVQFGRTHRATGDDGAFWDGTEAEFRAQFEKV